MKTHFLPIVLLAAGLLLGSCEKEYDLEALQGSTWTAQQLKHDEAGKMKASGTYTLSFSDTASFSIDLDVNTCFGSYELGEVEGEINMLPIACTQVCCDGEFAEQMANILSKAETYFIQDDELTFESASNWVRFRRE